MRKFRQLTSDFRLVILAIVAALTATVALFRHNEVEIALPDGSDSTSQNLNDDASVRYRQRYYSSPQPLYNAFQPKKVEQFEFDPNTADSTMLLRLGLSPSQVRGIYKYRAMGGQYHQKQDFAHVPGLAVKDYRRLEPYIVISEAYRPASQMINRPSEQVPRDTIAFPTKLREGQQVNLNSADTTELKRIPGVGSYFARQIVSYRDRLGGFASTEQLMEIQGFPSTALHYFRVEGNDHKRLNLNKASLNELRHHPYIHYYRAHRIMEYRRLYGRIKSLEQLLTFNEFSQSDIKRLAPYVEY